MYLPKKVISSCNQLGASLVELIIILAIVGFLVLLLSSLPSSIGLIGKSRYQSIAREIATKQIEDKRVVQYANLADGIETISDSRLTILPAGTGIILTEPCDPATCPEEQNLSAKQLTVTVSWKEGPDAKSITLKTLIAEGGLNQ